jgi:hypothetical protein
VVSRLPVTGFECAGGGAEHFGPRHTAGRTLSLRLAPVMYDEEGNRIEQVEIDAAR